MSLPRDILDQLLSGYLDDALSDDERARVERLLQDDPAVAGELRELTELRATLREIHRADQQIRLPGGFADRVLQAAAAQAVAEGLPEDHPINRMAQRSITVPRQGLPVGKIAGALIALAASTIVAIAVLRPDQDPENGVIAKVAPAPLEVDPVKVDPIDQGSPRTPVEQIVENDRPGPIVTPMIETPENVGSPVGDANVVAPANIAQNPLPSVEELNVLTHGFVMVLDVRQSEEGRQGQAVNAAMAKAGLKAANQKHINKNVVGFSKKLSETDESVSVLYLEGPSKRLDNFINRMVLDLEGIESVGFRWVTDAPIVGVANALRSVDDPTAVRHSASWNLTDDAGDSVQVLAQELSQQEFTPFQRSENEPNLALLNAGGKDGLDVQSRLFVLVR